MCLASSLVPDSFLGGAVTSMLKRGNENIRVALFLFFASTGPFVFFVIRFRSPFVLKRKGREGI